MEYLNQIDWKKRDPNHEDSDPYMKQNGDKVPLNTEFFKGEESSLLPPAYIGSDIKRVETPWFWYPFMVDKNINILGGEQDVGKTFFLAAFAAAITTSQPEGMPGELRRTGRVLYLGSENDKENFMERFDMTDGNDSKIMIVEDVFHCMDVDMTLERYIDYWNPCIVIFDPFFDFSPLGMNMNSQTDARDAMAYIRKIARDKQISFLLVIHPPKKQYEKIIDRFAGSGGFTATARTAIYTAFHPSKKSFRVGFQAKNNNAKSKLHYTYELDPDLGFIWHGTEDITEKEIIQSERNGGGKSNLDHYAMIVRGALKFHKKDGMHMTASEILREYSKICDPSTSSVALGQALGRPAMVDVLQKEGIILRKGSKTNGLQKYRIMYEDSQIKIV